MKVAVASLALISGLVFVPALAQDEPAKDEAPKAAEEKAPEPAKNDDAAKPAEEKAPEAAKEEAAKPAAEAAPSAAAAPAAAAAAAPAAASKDAKAAEPPKAAPAKELSPCAKAYVPLADSYKKSYEDMQKWIAQIDAQTGASADKMKKLQEQIQANESAATKAKLDGDKAKVKSLGAENKQLWAQMDEAKKAQEKTCADFAKSAGDRVKQYAEDANKALAASKSK